jgi:DnaJ family protein C protein 17
MTDITKLDLYELFDVIETASTQEITSAFRKKAIKCHPDKFPNDDEKKELFLKIKKAVEILTDEQARKAYDANRKQKIQQQERLSKMDGVRKKFKEDLERNEQKASQVSSPVINKTNSDRLKTEIERLRREGNRLVDEELEKIHQIIEDEVKQKVPSNHQNVIIKYFPNTPAYSDQELRIIFEKYGNISTIINMYPKRALIEFNNDHISSFIENEKGLEGRPFASVKIQKQKSTVTTTTTTKKQPEVVDLTRPELEDFEAMVFNKIAAQTATS